MIRALTRAELNSPDVAHLSWLAAEIEAGDHEVFARDQLARLSTLGVFEHDTLVAFTAFAGAAPSNTADDPVVLEYLATHEGAQGRGYGRALVAAIQEKHPRRTLFAETDDDAVEFYRRLGFSIEHTDSPDPRWPDRRRYRCTLAT